MGLDGSLPAQVLADAEEAGNEITRFDAEFGDEITPFSRSSAASESAAPRHPLRARARRHPLTLPDADAPSIGVAGTAVTACHRCLLRPPGPTARGTPLQSSRAFQKRHYSRLPNGRRLVADLRSIRGEWNSLIVARRHSAVHRVSIYSSSTP